LWVIARIAERLPTSTWGYQISTFALAGATNKAEHTCTIATDAQLEKFKLLAGGKRAAIALEGDSPYVKVLDLATCRSLGQWPDGGPVPTIISADGTRVALPARDGEEFARVVDVDRGTELKVPIESAFVSKAVPVPVFGFSCDGMNLIVANTEGTFEVIDLASLIPKRVGRLSPPGDLARLPPSNLGLLGVVSDDGTLLARQWLFGGGVVSPNGGQFLDVVDLRAPQPALLPWSQTFFLKPVADPGPTLSICSIQQSGILTFTPDFASLWSWGDSGHPFRVFSAPYKTPIEDVTVNRKANTVLVAALPVVASFRMGTPMELNGGSLSRDIPFASVFDGDPIAALAAISTPHRSGPITVARLMEPATADIQGPTISSFVHELSVAGGSGAVAAWYNHTLCLFLIGKKNCSVQVPAYRMYPAPSGGFSGEGHLLAYLERPRRFVVLRVPSANRPSVRWNNSETTEVLPTTDECVPWRASRNDFSRFDRAVVRVIPEGHELINFAIGEQPPSVITMERDDKAIIHIYDVDLTRLCTREIISRRGSSNTPLLSLSENDDFLALSFPDIKATETEVIPLHKTFSMPLRFDDKLVTAGVAHSVAIANDGRTVALGYAADDGTTFGSEFSRLEVWNAQKKLLYVAAALFGSQLRFRSDGVLYSFGRGPASPRPISAVWAVWQPKFVLRAACGSTTPMVDPKVWNTIVPDVPYAEFRAACDNHASVWEKLSLVVH
jgi:hypothetical protein